MGAVTNWIVLYEYGKIIRGGADFAAVPNDDPQASIVRDEVTLPPANFDVLEKFVLQNAAENAAKEEFPSGALDFLRLTTSRGGAKVLTARNYVGVLAMKDGTVIEVRPKINVSAKKDANADASAPGDAPDRQDADRQFEVYLDMLRVVLDIKPKCFDAASLRTSRMPLHEIFIHMFLQEVRRLLKHGLKYGYVRQEGNEYFLKGRLDFSQQIRYNLAHKEKFYVHYDEFLPERPENRLIKSTLLFISRQSRDGRNRQDCRRCLDMFVDVTESVNYAGDFAKYTANRNMREYDQLMKWCRVFLMRKSFTVFSGNDVAWSLLFPMNELFEKYVAQKLSERLAGTAYKVKAQSCDYCLYDNPSCFALRPDIVVSEAETSSSWVLDTKWKKLDPDDGGKYGISPGDMYQMYAYQKKYRCEKVILIYPLSEEFVVQYGKELAEGWTPSFYSSSDGVRVETVLFDLMDLKGSLDNIEGRLQLVPVTYAHTLKALPELFVNFFDQEDVAKSWRRFVDAKCDEELGKIIADEKLDGDRTRKFRDNVFRTRRLDFGSDGKGGQGIEGLLPSNHDSLDARSLVRKFGLFAKMKAFFDTYSGLVNPAWFTATSTPPTSKPATGPRLIESGDSGVGSVGSAESELKVVESGDKYEGE